jgi:peptidoglycan/xylan/chitin deacetylase (PgdA/CDA1 family)
VGYGRRRPYAAWPGNARVAISFVLNYEEGGERNVLDGDPHAEIYLTPEIVGMPAIPDRNPFVEDGFEYGSRAGFWRVLDVFAEHRLPFTAWAVGLALKRHPDAGRAMTEAGHEVASHSWRWIDYSARSCSSLPAKRRRSGGLLDDRHRRAYVGTPGAIARIRGGSLWRKQRPSTIRMHTMMTCPTID